MTTVEFPERRRGSAARVVLRQELSDLWLGGRGLVLSLGFSLLVSVVAYLAASNRTLNFLEQREAVSLTVQVAVAVGMLLTLIAAADAISGERERGTLEGLLLTPSPRSSLIVGKLLASLSLWLVAALITLPYIWLLAPGSRFRRAGRSDRHAQQGPGGARFAVRAIGHAPGAAGGSRASGRGWLRARRFRGAESCKVRTPSRQCRCVVLDRERFGVCFQ